MSIVVKICLFIYICYIISFVCHSNGIYGTVKFCNDIIVEYCLYLYCC